jgi:MFS family permease
VTIERALTWSTATSSLAKGVLFSISALFFTRVIGLPATTVGTGLTIAGAAGIAAAYGAGHLADRIGARRILLGATVAQGAALGAYVLARTPLAFVLVACVAVGAQGAQRTAQATLLAGAFTGPGRVRTRARLRVVTNMGVGAGSAVAAGALAIQTLSAYAVAMLAAACLVLASAWPLRTLPNPAPSHPAPSHPAPSHPAAEHDAAGRVGGQIAGAQTAGGFAAGGPTTPERALPERAAGRRAPLRDRRYLGIAGLNGVINMQFGLLTVGVPLWVAGHTRAPAGLVALLLVLNTVVVTLSQIPAARLAGNVRAAGRAVLAAGVLLVVACLLYAGAGHGGVAVAVVLLVLAVLAHSGGEVLSEAGSWELAFELADPRFAGAYQGVSQTGVALGTMLAPAVVTTTAVTHGTPGWLALGALFLAAAAGTLVIVSKSAAGPPARPRARLVLAEHSVADQ